jgi:hypothetical protein
MDAIQPQLPPLNIPRRGHAKPEKSGLPSDRTASNRHSRRAPVEPDRAEERIDRLDQQDGPGKAVVVKIDP